MNQLTDKFHEIGCNLIPAIAYGDATGLPYETGPPRPQGSVTGLVPIRENKFLGEYPAGTWSDDTQLSLAVIESLLACERFDLDDQADMHVLAMRHSLGEVAMADWIPAMVADDRAPGWGGSTVRSMRRLMNGIEPTESGELGGAGNGVLMKMAPLAYWQHLKGVDPEQSSAELVQLTRMTHLAPEATVSSVVHADVLKGLMQLGEDQREDIPHIILQSASHAKKYERLMNAEAITSTLLHELVEVVKADELTAETIGELAPNGGFYAPETLVMAYGSFLRERVFPYSVYRAVELGGDSDSVASVVGAMSVCAYGAIEKPHDIDQLFDFPRLQDASQRLAAAANPA